MYVCGITPYDATHIGHAATYIAFDLLYRAWLDAGQRVVYTSNVTDVDDPLLERATATGVDWTELATSQITLFFDDMSALGVLPPHTYLSAVESVPMVISATRHLLESGRAYRVPVPAQERPVHSPAYDIYADVTSDPDFGSISGYTSEERVRLFTDRGGDPATPGKKIRLTPSCGKRNVRGNLGGTAMILGGAGPAGTLNVRPSLTVALDDHALSKVAGPTSSSPTMKCPPRTLERFLGKMREPASTHTPG